MTFKESLIADNLSVFLNLDEFADARTIVYDGVTYRNVKCVISHLKAQDRPTNMRDHAQGIYLVSEVLHCALSELGGIVPEKGGRITVSDPDGFMRPFYVSEAHEETGMIRLELEAMDE